MSAPCESRQSSHTRALAEARGEAPGREFHVSGGNWRNNPPELRPPAASPQNARMRGIPGTCGRPRRAYPHKAALFRAQKCRMFRMAASLRLIS